MKRRRQIEHTGVPDVHLQFGRKPIDAKAAEESCQVDAAADREWFARNPLAIQRERLASSRELKAQGLLPGTLAVIFRGPCGAQIRMFVTPSATN
ncbi:hypothetical protein [Schlesneria sp.]|uniref:hypothetical protein n=1 Tax=Schlesneria sp. TaxID=2762018 RepID=UPI002F21CD93